MGVLRLQLLHRRQQGPQQVRRQPLDRARGLPLPLRRGLRQDHPRGERGGLLADHPATSPSAPRSMSTTACSRSTLATPTGDSSSTPTSCPAPAPATSPPRPPPLSSTPHP